MSDIVERLRDLQAEFYGDKCLRSDFGRAAAEIERLREIISQVADNIAGAPATIVEHSAEVGKALRRLDTRDAEIKRLSGWLREVVEDFRLDADDHDSSRKQAIVEALREGKDAKDEIERLREENNKLRSDSVALQDMRQKSEAEIERLRLQVKMLPLPEYRDDPRLHEVIDAQRAEIERLRGLLTAWVVAFETSDYPETMVEKVSYGSDTGVGTKF